MRNYLAEEMRIDVNKAKKRLISRAKKRKDYGRTLDKMK